MKVERDPAEFGEQLATELRHLRRSSEEYDAGDRTEAQRLSVIVRKLVHDTRSSTSLLTHLGIKDELRYFDTRLRIPDGFPMGAVIIHSGIVMTQFGPDGVHYAPFLQTDDPERSAWVEFSDWWRATVVSDLEGNEFSRFDLALGLANQDGGAHIDRRLDAKYAALTRSNSLGQAGSDATGDVRALGPEIALATVRQIAFELDYSLQVYRHFAGPDRASDDHR